MFTRNYTKRSAAGLFFTGTYLAGINNYCEDSYHLFCGAQPTRWPYTVSRPTNKPYLRRQGKVYYKRPFFLRPYFQLIYVLFVPAKKAGQVFCTSGQHYSRHTGTGATRSLHHGCNSSFYYYLYFGEGGKEAGNFLKS